MWFSQIRLRASIRIGQLVLELDTAPGVRSDFVIANDEPVGRAGPMLKMDAIKQAGLTQRTANRYEEVAGRRDMQAQVARRAAAEHRFATARTDICAPPVRRRRNGKPLRTSAPETRGRS